MNDMSYVLPHSDLNPTERSTLDKWFFIALTALCVASHAFASKDAAAVGIVGVHCVANYSYTVGV